MPHVVRISIVGGTLLMALLVGLQAFAEQNEKSNAGATRASAANRSSSQNASGQGAKIVVKCRDGLMRRGVIDSRTDTRQLWLQRKSKSIAISFAIPWRQIEKAKIDGRWFEGAELIEAAVSAPAAGKVSYFELSPAAESLTNQLAARPQRQTNVSRPMYIEIYAHTENWDADTARDGVKIDLSVLGADDQRLQTAGVFKAELWGSYRSAPTRPTQWKRLAAWTRTVAATDFRNGEATLRLKYPSRNPELHPGYGSDAIVHVRFQPRRAGILEASQTIRLHSYDRLRDQLQTQTGSRFLPSERTR